MPHGLTMVEPNLGRSREISGWWSGDLGRSRAISSDRGRSHVISGDLGTRPRQLRSPAGKPEISRDQPRSHEITRDRPRSAEITRDRPGSTEISRDQPGSAEINRDRPRSAGITRDQPRSPETGRDQPRSAEISMRRGRGRLCVQLPKEDRAALEGGWLGVGRSHRRAEDDAPVSRTCRGRVVDVSWTGGRAGRAGNLLAEGVARVRAEPRDASAEERWRVRVIVGKEPRVLGGDQRARRVVGPPGERSGSRVMAEAARAGGELRRSTPHQPPLRVEPHQPGLPPSSERGERTLNW